MKRRQRKERKEDWQTVNSRRAALKRSWNEAEAEMGRRPRPAPPPTQPARAGDAMNWSDGSTQAAV